MSTTPADPRGQQPAGVSAVLALVMSTVLLFALAIFGLGALSFATDRDIIAVPGLGQAPGAIGIALAVVVFATGSWVGLRQPRPTYQRVWLIAPATALMHLLGVWMSILISTGEAVTATVVAGDFVREGTSVVLLLAAAVASWAGVAMRRTRSTAPRWPWEDEE